MHHVATASSVDKVTAFGSDCQANSINIREVDRKNTLETRENAHTAGDCRDVKDCAI